MCENLVRKGGIYVTLQSSANQGNSSGDECLRKVKDRSLQVIVYYFVGLFVSHIIFRAAVLQRKPKPTNLKLLCALYCGSSPVVELFEKLPDPRDDKTAASKPQQARVDIDGR